MRHWLLAFLLAASGAVAADETVRICHGYGCLAQTDIRYTEGQLGEVRRMLFAAVDAENERKMLAEAVGRLYAWAGEQSDIRNDRGGNFADGHVSGKMDCIDHSTSTTRLLKTLEARSYLRWHRVVEPVARGVGGSLAAQASGLEGDRPVHEELGRRRHRGILLVAPGSD